MYCTTSLILFSLIYFTGTLGDLAPFITPCRSSDATCLKSSAQKAVPFLAAGVPHLGVNPMDPMHIDRVQATQAGLVMDFKDTTVKGLKKCEVLNLKRLGLKILLTMKCSVTLIGDYELGGKLLILPINGDGRYKINIRDIVVKIWFDVKENEENGVNHWTITSWKHTTEVKTGARFRFENLFHGNKQLSESIHNFANTNWKEILGEVAPPIIKAIISKIVDEVKNLFSNLQVSQMALD